jgi:branched-subunit amino acid ABC-type transport system permease component
MKKICQFYKQLFPNSRQAVIAALIGLSISLTIYLGLLQRHFFSWTYLAYAVLIAAAGFHLVGWLNKRFIYRLFSETPKPARNFALLFSVLLSLILLFNTEIQPLYYILPDSNLTIRFTIPALPEGEEGVRLLWVKTGQGFGSRW